MQKYLGVCDSTTASFRVTEDKLGKLQALIEQALEDGSVKVSRLEKIAGKCISMSVAIRPASLWSHFMISAISGAKDSTVSLRSHRDLCAELKVWLSLSATSQEGPWHQARHYEVKLTTASSDASTIQYGGMVSLPNGPFSMGGSSRPTSYPGLYTVKTCSRY